MSISQDIANTQIKEIKNKRNLVSLIHYACENFVDVKKGSPEIVSIAIMDFVSGQVITFARSDHEKEIDLLEHYSKFLEENKDRLYIHWNMNDSVYGFEAIRNRYLQLTGKQMMRIRSDHIIDLDGLLERKFKKGYIDHPKLQTIANLNGYSMPGFLTGRDEAECFKKGNFFEVKMSTIRKAHIISHIVGDLLDNRLRTKEAKIKIILRAIEQSTHYRIIAAVVMLGAVLSIIWAFIRYIIPWINKRL